jgi:para-nitrobenzyl esterase
MEGLVAVIRSGGEARLSDVVGITRLMRPRALGIAKSLALLGALALCSSSLLAGSSDPTVALREQIVRGRADEVPGVNRFLGIPYAAPPVGELRWREPQPVPPTPGTFDAGAYSPSCTQVSRAGESVIFPSVENERFSEDCLYLNIWAPAAGPATPLPVIVWIHGGGFMAGTGASPMNRGADLARKGAIVVSVNYRLGPLGFLVLPELAAESVHGVSGNYGLLDQIAALKWVRANIAAFGGNPDNVTIVGWSAGSASVNALQATPLARGLFHRAIGHSGANMNPRAGIWRVRTVAEANQYGRDYMKLMGAQSLAQLRALPAQTLADAPPKFWVLEDDGFLFDGEIFDIFASGRQTKVPVMAGAAAQEWTLLGMDHGWIKPVTPDELAQAAQLYGAPGQPNGHATGDSVLWQTREWVRLNAKAGVRDSYMWFATHAPPAPPRADGVAMGAYHGSELPFVFGTQRLINLPWTAAERQLSDTLSEYWLNFARNGNPNGPQLPEWPTYEEGKIMELASPPRSIALPRSNSLRFLDDHFARQRAEVPR